MGGGGGSAPTPPPLKKVNVPKVEALATELDSRGYNLSDADFTKRFPELVKGRDYSVSNSVSNLQGQTDPAISGALDKAGFEGTDLGSNEFQQARSLGQPILAKEQRDRNYFQNLLQSNPQRAFGLSGGDVASLAMANIGAQNQYNQNTYATRLQGYNSNLAQNAQLFGALAGSIGSIGSSAINHYYQPSNYLSPSQYSTSYAPYVPVSGGLAPGA